MWIIRWYVISPHSPPHSLQYSKNMKNVKKVVKLHLAKKNLNVYTTLIM